MRIPAGVIAREGSARWLLLAFVCLFLLLQTSALLHHHEGELQPRLDCHLCLKLGASDDMLPSTGLLPTEAETDRFTITLSPGLRVKPAPVPQSRSPPRFLI